MMTSWIIAGAKAASRPETAYRFVNSNFFRMQKTVLGIVAVAVLAIGGWFGYQQYTAFQLRRAEHARQVVQQAAAAAHLAEVAAKQHAFAVAAEVARQKNIAAAQAARKETEEALTALKVTSLLPGNPGLAIIDKTEYAEGDSLTLTGGKRLLIASIKAGGIALSGNGQTFHLDPPSAPDLAAARRR
jgi:hypothetical protein